MTVGVTALASLGKQALLQSLHIGLWPRPDPGPWTQRKASLVQAGMEVDPSQIEEAPTMKPDPQYDLVPRMPEIQSLCPLNRIPDWESGNYLPTAANTD